MGRAAARPAKKAWKDKDRSIAETENQEQYSHKGNGKDMERKAEEIEDITVQHRPFANVHDDRPGDRGGEGREGPETGKPEEGRRRAMEGMEQGEASAAEKKREEAGHVEAGLGREGSQATSGRERV